MGKGVSKAVENINKVIAPAVMVRHEAASSAACHCKTIALLWH